MTVTLRIVTTSGIDQNRRRPQRLLDLTVRRFQALRRQGVSCEKGGLPAVPGNRRHTCLAPLSVPPQHSHCRAGFGQPLGHGAAQHTRGPNDDSDFA